MSRPDNADTTSLQHALATIEDWGIDPASLLEVLEDEQSPQLRHPRARSRPSPAAAYCVRAPPTSAPYKPRHDTLRKRELVALREQAEVLHQTLTHQRMRHATLETATSLTASEAAALQHECREIVMRQCDARVAAQMQNKNLRKLMAQLRRDADKIERLSRRLLSLEKSLPRMNSATACSNPRFHTSFEAPQLQLLRLPGLKQEAATVFTSGAFAAHGSKRLKTFREVVLRDVDSTLVDTIQVVFETAWVLPFPVDEVANALWIQTTRVTARNYDIQWLDVFEDEASLVSQFVSTPTDDASNSTKCGQIATHRERLGDGRSTQLVSNVQAKAVVGGTCVGVYNSDVWTRVEPISTSESCYQMSQVLWCRRVRLQPPVSLCRTPAECSQWKRTVLSSSMRTREESMVTCNMQAVENLLVVRAATTK